MSKNRKQLWSVLGLLAVLVAAGVYVGAVQPSPSGSNPGSPNLDSASIVSVVQATAVETTESSLAGTIAWVFDVSQEALYERAEYPTRGSAAESSFFPAPAMSTRIAVAMSPDLELAAGEEYTLVLVKKAIAGIPMTERSLWYSRLILDRLDQPVSGTEPSLVGDLVLIRGVGETHVGAIVVLAEQLEDFGREANAALVNNPVPADGTEVERLDARSAQTGALESIEMGDKLAALRAESVVDPAIAAGVAASWLASPDVLRQLPLDEW